MATGKTVCGVCGAGLAQDAKFCPRCGSRVDVSPSSQPAEGAGVVRCKACGREVPADANFCESCGAALKGGARPPKVKTKQRPQEQGKRFRLERWQMVTGAVVVLVIGFFAYMELTRDRQGPASAARENTGAPLPEMMQAIEQLQGVVDANPADAASTLRLANMLHDAGMRSPMLFSRAITTYQKYLALKPDDPNARVDLGICYFEMGRADTNNTASWFSKAIQEMQTALAANPKHQPAAFNLGIVNLNTGNLEEANKWFKKAAEIDPNSDLGKKAQQMIEQHTFPGQTK